MNWADKILHRIGAPRNLTPAGLLVVVALIVVGLVLLSAVLR